MHGQPQPLSFQIAIAVLSPPILACGVFLMSRGWALAVRRGTLSEATRHRQARMFWGLLVIMYIMMPAIMTYLDIQWVQQHHQPIPWD